MAVVIFKAIEKCNSNCIYCDVVKKKYNDIMKFDLLKLIFKRINEYLEYNPFERLDFTWHGGEVCLLGANYFKVALEFQEKYCRKTKERINHQVQSNLTLINQQIVDAFKKLGIKQVGSSFEPIHNIRGFGKKRDSHSYNRKFINGIRLLNQNNMTWGVIYVVHRKSLEIPLEIFYYLTNLNVRSHPNLNMVKIFDDDPHGLAITGEEFADFLGAIFPVWWKHRERYPDVQPFKGYVRNIKEKDMTLVCESSGKCSYNWIYIGPNGETSQCGRGGDYNILNYGNITDQSFNQVLQNPQRDYLAQRSDFLALNECNGCRFWGICHGGCPLDAYMEYGDYMRKTPGCSATKIFIEKYFEPVTGLKADFLPKRIKTQSIN
jgi:uncharacterized protein